MTGRKQKLASTMVRTVGRGKREEREEKERSEVAKSGRRHMYEVSDVARIHLRRAGQEG